MEIPKQGPVISIDGPAGTGKSSVTHRLADVLGFVHVDTGALYRAVAYLTLKNRKKLSPSELKSETENEVAISIAKSSHLEFQRDLTKNPSNRLFANGNDISEFIRTAEVSMAASRVSAIPEIRAALLGLQRRLGCQGKAILEGRDIGTVVFPDADIKFFLTASLEERAKRRLIELEAAGIDAPSFEDLKSQIAIRDRDDMTRAISPLKKPDGCVEIDTSHMTLDEVVEHMRNVVENRLGKRKD